MWLQCFRRWEEDDPVTEARYGRNIGAITEEEQRSLGEKRVFIAGCGGLGGGIIAQLLRIGVGHITAIDADEFEVSNLNRQLLCTENVLGKKKAEVAASYARTVNSQVEFHGICGRLTRENSRKLLAEADLFIDALDNIESRKAAAAACGELGIPMIYGAVRGWMLQVSVLLPEKAVEKLELLYPEKVILNDKSSTAFTPAVCGGIQVAEAIKLLLGRKSELEGKMLYGDLLNAEWEIIPL